MRKYITIIFSIYLISLVFLTACNQNSEPEKPDISPSPQTMSLDGREIIKAAWWNTAWPEFGRTEAEDKIISELKQIYEKYDFTIRFYNIAYEDYYNVITTSISSGVPMSDVFWTDAAMLTGELIPNAQVEKISDTANIDLTSYKWDPLVKQASTVNDDTYGLYWGRVTPGTALFCNQELIDAESVKNSVAGGTWDWNAFIEAAKKAIVEVGSEAADGAADEAAGETAYASPVYAFGGNYTDTLLASNGGAVNETDALGATRFAIYDIETVQALEMLREMSTISGFLASDTAIREDFLKGNIAFWCDTYINMKEYMAGGEKAASSVIEIADIPFPKGPDAEGYVSLVEKLPMLVMPKGVKDKNAVAFAINAYTDVLWENMYKDWRGTMTDAAAGLVDDGNCKYAEIDRADPAYQIFLSFRNVLMGGTTSTEELLEMFRLQFEACK